jgi:hypothetical protein
MSSAVPYAAAQSTKGNQNAGAQLRDPSRPRPMVRQTSRRLPRGVIVNVSTPTVMTGTSTLNILLMLASGRARAMASARE